MLELYPDVHLYVLDIKRRDFNDWSDYIVQTPGNSPGLLTGKSNIQVWQPLDDIPDEIERWLHDIMTDAPAIAWINEMSALGYTEQSAYKNNNMYKRMQKLGRDLPVMTISESQELAGTARTFLGQADHVVRFTLEDEWDKNRMKRLMHGLEEPFDKYGFHYRNIERAESPVYFKGYQEFFH